MGHKDITCDRCHFQCILFWFPHFTFIKLFFFFYSGEGILCTCVDDNTVTVSGSPDAVHVSSLCVIIQ